ncbi:MAG: hypothetical protein JWO80_5267 [Bryobacterales bacterium]|nr:hypothetical protein [Bryobacterales bacterium]
MLKKASVVVGALVLLLAIGLMVVTKLPALNVQVPELQPSGELTEVNQGWNDAQRQQFHHTAQGTRLVPYAWFKALEQPCFSLIGCKLFADPEYLGRFGFIPSKPDPRSNPDGLPVGFSYQKDFYDPMTGKVDPALGLTCAACHTGEIRYNKYSLVIEGAPATIEVTQFQKALGLSLAFTQLVPFRFGRFASRVLRPNATDAEKAELKKNFTEFMANAKLEIDATNKKKIYVNEAGFTRTDALTRIGNQVFAVDMKNDDNYAVSNAPVRYPQIWDASWFNWVQYNSSIANPIIRNVGEALGVRAVAKLYGPDASKFENSVHVEGLWEAETLLSGPAPFQGLQSPKWPAVFPAIDTAKAPRGAALYKQHCAGCHLPPVDELIVDLNSPKPAHWWKNSQGKQFLVVTDVKMDYVGTDPREAADFIARTADTGALNQGRVSAAAGLDLVTRGIGTNYFTKMGFSPEKQIEWSGYRDPKDVAVRAVAIYKARPLNGIWAVGPYLHNGSVPSLYELLSPQAERPDKFWTGSKEFDPVKVGRNVSELRGGYLFDVTTTGNSNKGHEFKDGPKGNGVIGPALSPEDRWALIEYLKSI